MEVATLRGGESERRPLTLLVAIMMLLDVVAKERQKREKERKKKRKQEEVGRAGREADERAGGEGHRALDAFIQAHVQCIQTGSVLLQPPTATTEWVSARRARCDLYTPRTRSVMVSQAGKDIVAGTAGGVAQASPVALCLCILSELTLSLSARLSLWSCSRSVLLLTGPRQSSQA